MIDPRPTTLLPSPLAGGADDGRFRLLVSRQRGSETAVHIYDRLDSAVLMKWRGEVARRLIFTSGLPESLRASGSHACSKTLLQRISLAATRIELEMTSIVALDARLATLDEDIPPPHRRTAELLFSHPGKHLSQHDVISLMLLQYSCIDRQHIPQLLDDLVAWGVVQRVEVGAHRRFYDIDTRPHLHVYCRETDELRDAPGSGVIHVAG